MALGNAPEGYVRVVVTPARQRSSLEGGRVGGSTKFGQSRSRTVVLTAMQEDLVFLNVNLLAKCEVECQYARIKKLDFEGPVLHRAFLSDQLIEAGPANFSSAVRR